MIWNGDSVNLKLIVFVTMPISTRRHLSIGTVQCSVDFDYILFFSDFQVCILRRLRTCPRLSMISTSSCTLFSLQDGSHTSLWYLDSIEHKFLHAVLFLQKDPHMSCRWEGDERNLQKGLEEMNDRPINLISGNQISQIGWRKLKILISYHYVLITYVQSFCIYFTKYYNAYLRQ